MEKENINAVARRLAMMAVLAIVLVLVAVMLGKAQVIRRQQPTDRAIDAAMQVEIIDSISAALNEVYVFPDVAKKMGQHLRKNLKEKKYSKIKGASEFADVLTKDLREISHDRHLGVTAMTPEILERYGRNELTPEARQAELDRMKYNNYSFVKAERLNGNVGYLKFNSFEEAAHGGATAVAALNFLNHVDALIIDLRENGGGNPSMIQLITSYFFEGSVHLNSFYVRKQDSIHQFWTQEHVEGEKMTDVDLYILTSDYTFSGAEEFTYNLKNLERATIIGETTGGGAHPVHERIFPNLLIGMRLPFGRAINPISGTNWEGTGVTPDIEVPEEQALDVAYKEALGKLKEKTDDENMKFSLQWAIDRLNSKLHPVDIDSKILKGYVGIYGPRTITFENGELYYQRIDRPKMKMVPMAEDLFGLENLEYFRIKVITDSNGNPVELHGLYDNGQVDISKKTEG